MKNMKKSTILILALLLGILALGGCGDKQGNEEEKPATPAVALADQFMKEIESEKDIMKVAESISENKAITLGSLVKEEISSKDFMPGFSKEIKEFKKAIKVQPMVSTIPFIYYVFETENPKKLVEDLKESADLRWNICVEADEMEIRESGNYVFFVMAPKSFEEQE